MERLRLPQPAQWRLRAFQSMRERAWARMAAVWFDDGHGE
jgi:hypothetical protein